MTIASTDKDRQSNDQEYREIIEIAVAALRKIEEMTSESGPYSNDTDIYKVVNKALNEMEWDR